MKKSIAVLLIVVGVLMLAIPVFADANELPDWFNDMMEWRKAQVQESVDEGLITQDQADAWLDHIEDMEEFHEVVGFPGPGGCHGGGFGGRSFGGHYMY